MLPGDALHPFQPDMVVIFTERSAQKALAGGAGLAPATPSQSATASRSSRRIGPATVTMMPKSSVRLMLSADRVFSDSREGARDPAS